MEDKFTRGFVAGLIGGTVSVVYTLVAGMAGLATLRIMDWIAICIFAHTPPFSVGEIAYATLGQLALAGVLGVVFAFWLPYVSSRNLLFKGWLFSVTVWFSIYAITTLFQMMGTVPTPLNTVIANFGNASIFGAVQAYALRALTPQESISFRGASMVPAMKPLAGESENENGSQAEPEAKRG